jgi:hypothetical protein
MDAPRVGGVTIDTLLPVYETRMVDAIIIGQPRAAVWEALEQLKGSDMPLANILGIIRAIPLAIRQRLSRSARETPAAPAEEPTFFELMGNGDSWVMLAREPERELTLGLIGKFWQMDLGFQPMRDREQFIAFDEPDYAKIVTTFRLEDIPSGTRLLTETRVHPTDEAAARKFNRYWRLMRPGASLTVRSMLNAIKRRAEGPAAAAGRPATIIERSDLPAGRIALIGGVGLFARALYLALSGAPARLRPIPRLLLYLEIVTAGLTTALSLWTWVLAPISDRRRREARARGEGGLAAALTQPAAPDAIQVGAGLSIGIWTFTLVVHAIRVAIYLSPSQGLKSDA